MKVLTMSDTAAAFKSKFPKKMLVWTALAIAVFAVTYWQAFYFNEKFNLDPGMLSIIRVLLGLMLIVTWAGWAFFFARHRLVGLLILLVPAGVFTLYHPNFSGDVAISGLKPRFWSSSRSFAIECDDSPVTVDLNTTSPIDFPQFLGPNRNAQIESVTLADSWDTEPELLWKIGVGEGWSGFVVVNGFAITQEQRDADECVTCYDVHTGKLVWINRNQRRHEDTMGMGKVGPRATPLVHEGLVYVTSGTGVLDCLQGSTGELVWSADVPKLVGISQAAKTNSKGLTYTMEDSNLPWGRSGSPLIFEDFVVVPAGGPATIDKQSESTAATLIAFDKKTGDEKWRGGNRPISYGSPNVATVGGIQQILLVVEDWAVGHDPKTGEELWSHSWLGKSSGDANCSQVTPVDNHRLILSKGYNMGGELIEVKQSDGDWLVTTLKKDPRVLKTKFTNPTIFDGHTYSLSDGYLECTQIDSFRRKWKQRGRFGNGQLLLVGDKLLVHAESGTLKLIQASPAGYQELASIKTIDGICWNTICLYGDLVLVRSDLEAACFRLPTVPK